MTKKVIVAIHEYRNGQTVRVFDTPAKAQEWKDEIGADNWGVVSKDPQPEDPCGDEYCVNWLWLNGEKEAARELNKEKDK